jgi:hypothetical protein
VAVGACVAVAGGDAEGVDPSPENMSQAATEIANVAISAPTAAARPIRPDADRAVPGLALTFVLILVLVVVLASVSPLRIGRWCLRPGRLYGLADMIRRFAVARWVPAPDFSEASEAPDYDRLSGISRARRRDGRLS